MSWSRQINKFVYAWVFVCIDMCSFLQPTICIIFIEETFTPFQCCCCYCCVCVRLLFGAVRFLEFVSFLSITFLLFRSHHLFIVSIMKNTDYLLTYYLLTCVVWFLSPLFFIFLNRKKWCVGVLLCILVSWQRRTQCLHNLYKKTEFLKVVCTVFLYFNLRLLLFCVCASVIHTYMNIYALTHTHIRVRICIDICAH